MTRPDAPRVLTIPPSAAFLPTLADALLDGRIVPGFRGGADPLALAGVTIFVPTRRAARALRAIFAERAGGFAVLPTIRPLGEFDEEGVALEPGSVQALDLAPPIAPIDRLLHLGRLVQAWRDTIKPTLEARHGEGLVMTGSTADALRLAGDLAALMDEVETQGTDWTRLADLAPADLAGWWQVTLTFLRIATERWPDFLAEAGRSNPAAHRSALIDLEAARLARTRPTAPVIAAGSTGSIPATARLLGVLARLPNGAVVLPGLDKRLDAESWSALAAENPRPPLLGHPQYGLAKLLARIGVSRGDVEEVAASHRSPPARAVLVSEALRPAETTDAWQEVRSAFPAPLPDAVAGVALVEAARESEEALAIAVALKLAAAEGRTAALVTGDRALARRVAADLARFGVRADDSGGTPLLSTAPGTLLRLMLEAAFRPGDAAPILALLKHPLLRLGLDRAAVRQAAGTIELVALRGGTGRPDATELAEAFERRMEFTAARTHPPFWLARLNPERIGAARDLAARIDAALAPLAARRRAGTADFRDLAHDTVTALEALGRDEEGGLAALYADDAGARMVEFLRGLVSAGVPFDVEAGEWPDVMRALAAAETVKPSPGAERRIAIWGTLEARLQAVDLLVIGGLNEGSWPRKAESDPFLSRAMKGGMGLEPPERRIGQAAHDLVMAMGTPEVVLTRSARAGEAPAVPSRWLQRLLAFAGPQAAEAMRTRGRDLLAWAGRVDDARPVPAARRPSPAPPTEMRPQSFSVTEIETLRRDPYAIYARRILKLQPLDPLVRDPDAAERGTLFHAILHRFSASGVDPLSDMAEEALVAAAAECFGEAALPADVRAVWWPRFLKLVPELLAWERGRAVKVLRRLPEAPAAATAIGETGATLRGFADRIDVLPTGHADILDYKTGAYPTKGQAHTLLSPQLALEGALLSRGAFKDAGRLTPADLAFVRLKPNGGVAEESILSHDRVDRSAPDLSEDAWGRLQGLVVHYRDPASGYVSRALPPREGEFEGDYDHLARLLEWSAGGERGEEASA